MHEDWGSGMREIEAKGVFGAPKAMKFKHQLLWHELGRSENHPTEHHLGHAKFVIEGVDQSDSRKLEVPCERWVCKGRYHGPRCAVDMKGNVDTSATLEVVQ